MQMRRKPSKCLRKNNVDKQIHSVWMQTEVIKSDQFAENKSYFSKDLLYRRFPCSISSEILFGTFCFIASLCDSIQHATQPNSNVPLFGVVNPLLCVQCFDGELFRLTMYLTRPHWIFLHIVCDKRNLLKSKKCFFCWKIKIKIKERKLIEFKGKIEVSRKAKTKYPVEIPEWNPVWDLAIEILRKPIVLRSTG